MELEFWFVSFEVAVDARALGISGRRQAAGSGRGAGSVYTAPQSLNR